MQNNVQCSITLMAVHSERLEKVKCSITQTPVKAALKQHLGLRISPTGEEDLWVSYEEQILDTPSISVRALPKPRSAADPPEDAAQKSRRSTD